MKNVVVWALLISLTAFNSSIAQAASQSVPSGKNSAFLFAGNWKLNLQKSKIPASSKITDERRSYNKKGDSITLLWSRTFKDNKKETGTYEFKCDGKKWVTGPQTIICTYSHSDSHAVMEGLILPSQLYFRNEVKNNELVIRVFKDSQHKQVVLMSVFDPGN